MLRGRAELRLRLRRAQAGQRPEGRRGAQAAAPVRQERVRPLGAGRPEGRPLLVREEVAQRQGEVGEVAGRGRRAGAAEPVVVLLLAAARQEREAQRQVVRLRGAVRAAREGPQGEVVLQGPLVAVLVAVRVERAPGLQAQGPLLEAVLREGAPRQGVGRLLAPLPGARLAPGLPALVPLELLLLELLLAAAQQRLVVVVLLVVVRAGRALARQEARHPWGPSLRRRDAGRRCDERCRLVCNRCLRERVVSCAHAGPRQAWARGPGEQRAPTQARRQDEIASRTTLTVSFCMCSSSPELLARGAHLLVSRSPARAAALGERHSSTGDAQDSFNSHALAQAGVGAASCRPPSWGASHHHAIDRGFRIAD